MWTVIFVIVLILLISAENTKRKEEQEARNKVTGKTNSIYSGNASNSTAIKQNEKVCKKLSDTNKEQIKEKKAINNKTNTRDSRVSQGGFKNIHEIEFYEFNGIRNMLRTYEGKISDLKSVYYETKGEGVELKLLKEFRVNNTSYVAFVSPKSRRLIFFKCLASQDVKENQKKHNLKDIQTQVEYNNVLDKFDLVMREAAKIQKQMKKQKEFYRQETFKNQANQRKKEEAACKEEELRKKEQAACKEEEIRKQEQLRQKEEAQKKTISKEDIARVEAFFGAFKPKETFIKLDLDNIASTAAQIRARDENGFIIGRKASTMYYEELIKALDECRLSYEDFAEIRDTWDEVKKFVDRISEDRYELSLWDFKQTKEECSTVFSVLRYIMFKFREINPEGLNKVITDETLNDASTDSVFEFCCAINDNLHYYPNDLYIYLVLYSCVPGDEREIFRRSIRKYLYNITDTFDSYDAGNDDKYSSSEIYRTTSSTSKWQSNPYGDNCEFDEDNAHYQDVL